MKLKNPLQSFGVLLTLLSLSAITTGCKAPPTPEPPVTPTAGTSPAAAEPSPTVTITLPTATPVPLAALVDEEPLTLAEYEAELARYLDSSTGGSEAGTELATEEAQQVVLEELINRLLLEQAAWDTGYRLEESQLTARIQALVDDLGSQQALSDWMNANYYTPESFRIDLKRQMAAGWMRNHIFEQIPTVAYQVRARQILLHSEAEAEAVLQALQNGDDFGALAAQYDRLTMGEIGWFPRGYLLYPQLDSVFELEPGEFSSVIETETGFYIIQVLEVETDRPLTPGARLELGRQELQTWLENRRQEREIQVYLP